jgi:hypothetical protein
VAGRDKWGVREPLERFELNVSLPVVPARPRPVWGRPGVGACLLWLREASLNDEIRALACAGCRDE